MAGRPELQVLQRSLHTCVELIIEVLGSLVRMSQLHESHVIMTSFPCKF